MNTAATHTSENEVTILARIIFGNEHSQLSPEMARHILDLRFSDRDKARMHDVAVRNQEDALSPAEKEVMLAFGKAGDLLAILKSKARRTLGIKPEKHVTSSGAHGCGACPTRPAAGRGYCEYCHLSQGWDDRAVYS